MNINVTLSQCPQMPVFVFGTNPNLRQCVMGYKTGHSYKREGRMHTGNHNDHYEIQKIIKDLNDISVSIYVVLRK